jgi:hypothetical protein
LPVTLITAEEINGLPEDDDAAAFVGFERICRDGMNAILARYGQNDDSSEIWFEYMVQVRAAAAAYDVREILDGPSPSYNRDTFVEFYTIAVSVSTQLALRARRDRMATTVSLSEGAKARLRNHAAALAEALDVSDLAEARKVSLRAKLREFNAELEQERSSMAKMLTAIALVTAALTPAAMLVGTVEDDIAKLPKAVAAVQQINAILGKAKAHEMDRAPPPVKLPTSEPRRAIEGPRRTSTGPASLPREDFSADLDDEIPF